MHTHAECGMLKLPGPMSTANDTGAECRWRKFGSQRKTMFFLEPDDRLSHEMEGRAVLKDHHDSTPLGPSRAAKRQCVQCSPEHVRSELLHYLTCDAKLKLNNQWWRTVLLLYHAYLTLSQRGDEGLAGGTVGSEFRPTSSSRREGGGRAGL